MNIRFRIFAVLALTAIIACDDDTVGLGSSVTPAEDKSAIRNDSCFATSRTVAWDDSLLVMSTQCNLGRYTEPVYGASFQSAFLTQLNCSENFNLPDSVYGIGSHTFPEWFIEDLGDQKPYYAELRLYFTSFFGDSTSNLKIDIFELDKVIDASRRYYPSFNPSEYCNTDKKPLASVSVSALNFNDSDSLRYLSTYYPGVSVRLPDSIAEKILSAYYETGGKSRFKDALTFMDNFCKGFYIRCSAGDGTILYIDQSLLQINFKCIDFDDDGEEYLASYMAEFPGNSEVMQFNCFKWTGLESRMAENDFSWIVGPFGLLTEITLPVDDMKEDNMILNSATMTLSAAKIPTAGKQAGIPGTLLLVRKDRARSFFSRNNTPDSEESFVTSYTSKYGTYTFSNIAALIEKACSDRQEWLSDNGLQADANGFAQYSQSHPDWDKILLIPVSANSDASGNVLGYKLNINLNQVKLFGGPDGSKIKIKTIQTQL